MLALDDCGLESELGRADGGDIAARPGTDDRHIEARHGLISCVLGTTRRRMKYCTSTVKAEGAKVTRKVLN